MLRPSPRRSRGTIGGQDRHSRLRGNPPPLPRGEGRGEGSLPSPNVGEGPGVRSALPVPPPRGGTIGGPASRHCSASRRPGPCIGPTRGSPPKNLPLSGGPPGRLPFQQVPILTICQNPKPPVVLPPSSPICPYRGRFAMRDKSGAHYVAPDGSRLAIVPTTSGGSATLPRAPGQDRPRTASSGAARPGRPRATPRAPDQDVPQTLAAWAPGADRPRAAPCQPVPDRPCAVQMAPGHDRPRTASSGAARPDRPRATPRAPGADVPPATPAGAPGRHRLRAAQRAPDHFRSRPAPTAPGHGRPLAASSDVAGRGRPRATRRAPDQDVPRTFAARVPGSDRLRAAPCQPVPDRPCPVQRAPGHGRPSGTSSGVPGHGRPRATLQAPAQDVPQAHLARAPGSDRPCAVAATVAAPDGPRVSSPVAGPASSHRGPAAGPRLTSLTHPTAPAHDLYRRAYTTQEVQQFAPAHRTPVLTAAVRLLLALIQRAQGLDIGRALAVLRCLLQDRPALPPPSQSAPIQSLDRAAAHLETPPQPPDPPADQRAPPSDRPPFKPP